MTAILFKAIFQRATRTKINLHVISFNLVTNMNVFHEFELTFGGLIVCIGVQVDTGAAVRRCSCDHSNEVFWQGILYNISYYALIMLYTLCALYKILILSALVMYHYLKSI
jgi:hypothetical protein